MGSSPEREYLVKVCRLPSAKISPGHFRTSFDTMPNALAPAAPITSAGYRTAPSQTETGFPPGVPYIIGNEAAERFSFYGMRAILVTFMTAALLTRSQCRPYADAKALGQHQFVSAVYFTPFLGAFLSDGFLGKYRTILWLSIVYCFGHFALAMNDTRLGLPSASGLISLGAGGIKPCVSANVGDQFGATNNHLLSKVFGWFYFSINVGSFLRHLALPDPAGRQALRSALGVRPAGRADVSSRRSSSGWAANKFVHIPPGRSNYLERVFQRRNGPVRRAAGDRLRVRAGVLGAVGPERGAEWTVQAKSLDLNFFGFKFLAEQVQVVNGIYVLAFIPLFNYVLYPRSAGSSR